MAMINFFLFNDVSDDSLNVQSSRSQEWRLWELSPESAACLRFMSSQLFGPELNCLFTLTAVLLFTAGSCFQWNIIKAHCTPLAQETNEIFSDQLGNKVENLAA